MITKKAWRINFSTSARDGMYSITAVMLMVSAVVVCGVDDEGANRIFGLGINFSYLKACYTWVAQVLATKRAGMLVGSCWSPYRDSGRRGVEESRGRRHARRCCAPGRRPIVGAISL